MIPCVLRNRRCCTADAAASFDPELLLAACAAAVLTVRGGARGRMAVLDFFSRRLAPQLVRLGAGDGGAAAAGHCGSGMPDSRAMRAWLRRVAPLAGGTHTAPDCADKSSCSGIRHLRSRLSGKLAVGANYQSQSGHRVVPLAPSSCR